MSDCCSSYPCNCIRETDLDHLLGKVRERIVLHGGRATARQLLPYVRATASVVKSLPGITTVREDSGIGRPRTVYLYQPANDLATQRTDVTQTDDFPTAIKEVSFCIGAAMKSLWLAEYEDESTQELKEAVRAIEYEITRREKGAV
ncbi:hypothetical protein ABZ616_14255 [Streptomyces noursei]|uniref:Uncharacterized protein n=1 Tax=Streptomyces mashuensis TaxID=33904 RepID=A0A919EF10_9ACTN|nr:hypothetical protein [Streptomyces mashuensis]GHF61158.1 hypothetical protein GCM10010218_48370 [Streptomyces mashuensis]